MRLWWSVRKLLRNCGQYNASWKCRTYSVLNRNYFSIKRKLPESILKDSFKQSPCSLYRNYGTLGQDRFTIFNPEYDKYLASLESEFDELHKPGFTDNRKNSKIVNRKFQELSSIVNLVKVLREKVSELQELSLIDNVDQDKEMESMIVEEKEKSKEEIRQLELQLVDYLVGNDRADNNDVILEVAAGVGGQEAMLFTSEVFDMYEHYCSFKQWSNQILSYEKSEYGGVRRAALKISGQDVFKYMKYEGGVHRVQRIPQTEKSGRIHTSTMSVAILPQPTEIDVVINSKDLRVETFRSSGAGGQSVNTTDSAVRIIHIPTGTVVECQEERSQIKNRGKAIQILRSRMYQKELEVQMAERLASRKIQVGSSDRSEKIRTYNFNQDRITDHRISQNLFNLQDFFSGGESLDDLIQTLMIANKFTTLDALLKSI